MTRKPVESSNIASVGYDESSKVMEVEFKNGGVYQYSGVPVQTYVEFIHWPSKGTYFARHIKDRYPTRKIESAAP